jgi:hypothetical protein
MRPSPKEKAKEIFDKFYILLSDADSDISQECLVSILSKKCAIIEVDEILDAIDWHVFETPNVEIEYWNEVKIEIEKM